LLLLLAANAPEQAMGFNVFTLFVGFGLGSLLFGMILSLGFDMTQGLLAACELVAAVV
jgi:predicted MFS family arabinose efflux permease